MASGVRLLLRLPPAIRQQVVACETAWSNICLHSQHCPSGSIGLHQTRTFSSPSCLAKNKQNVSKNAQPQKPTVQAHNLPKAVPPLKFAPGSAPPTPNSLAAKPGTAPAPQTYYSSQSDWIGTRFPNTERVLLYVAPRHGGFFALAIMSGMTFLVGSYNYAQTLLKDEEGKPKTPWYVKVLGGVPTLAFAVIGTAFLLAPIKVIKSATLVKAPGAPTVARNAKLRLEIKRVMPFAKPDVMEIAPDQLILDRNVPQAMSDVKFTSYHLRDHRHFTEYYFSGELEKKHGSALSRLNRTLLNAWPSLVKNTKRMFLRDQMAYVRIPGNGNYKLDLQGSHMLDSGNVLSKITKEEYADRGVAGWIRSIGG